MLEFVLKKAVSLVIIVVLRYMVIIIQCTAYESLQPARDSKGIENPIENWCY